MSDGLSCLPLAMLSRGPCMTAVVGQGLRLVPPGAAALAVLSYLRDEFCCPALCEYDLLLPFVHVMGEGGPTGRSDLFTHRLGRGKQDRGMAEAAVLGTAERLRGDTE